MALPAASSRLRLALVLAALAVVGTLAAHRQGAFDPPRVEGMTEAPCPPASANAPGLASRIATALRGDAERRRLRDWPQLCQYREANRRVMAGPAPDAVFIGDSITVYWANAEPALFSGGRINRGINSQTSPQILLRFHPDAIALGPRVIHLLAGFNDVSGKTGPNHPEDFRNNMRAMADIAEANGVALVIGTITPPRFVPDNPDAARRARIVELNGWLRKFASARGIVLADYHAVLVGRDNAMRQNLTDDGIHPNAAGYAAMRPVMEKALAGAAGPTKAR